MRQYLANSEYINWHHPLVAAKAGELSRGCLDDVEIARRCYEFVRDEIRHSMDFKLNPVTCKASDVLLYGTGYCYAKSHLLAALLRASGIPAGLCYQRLLVETNGERYSLHGLNAVYLRDFGWYRMDARSNKDGVQAEFCPPVEKLTFSIVEPGEADLPEIWAEPLPAVAKVLIESATWQEVYDNLPDVQVRRTYAAGKDHDARRKNRRLQKGDFRRSSQRPDPGIQDS